MSRAFDTPKAVVPLDSLAPLASPRSVHVLINPAAGQDKPVLAILARVLAEHGIPWTMSILRREDDVQSVVDGILDGESPPEWLAVSGGDGTVSIVARALAGRDVPLAILPGGTGNVVAQHLGFPIDYEEAAQSLFGGVIHVRPLDLVDAAGCACILRAGLGADARMMASADTEAKARLGWGAYVQAAFEQISEDQHVHLHVEVDGASFDCEVLTVLVMNIGRLGRGGGDVSSNITPEDGQLDLVIVRAGSLPTVMTLLRSLLDSDGVLPQSASGKPGDDGLCVEHIRGRIVEVTPRSATEFQIDGDPRPALVEGHKVRFAILPRAIQCVAPRLASRGL